jgi:predicted RNA-binding Zn-ribbon protein involved in translation (DUF1610 family)
MEDTIPITKPSVKIPDSVNMPAELRQKLQEDIDKKAAESNPSAIETEDTSIPSETIELPSKGFFYSDTNPLSSGKIRVKYMTAKEEDILTNQTLVKNGTVLDKLLEALIVTPGVSLDSMLLGDKNAVFVASRILAYGNEYTTKIKCPECGKSVLATFDLDDVKCMEYDFTGKTRGNPVFKTKLPMTKAEIEYKLVTHGDEKRIDEELTGLEKISRGQDSPEVTTRFKHIIKSVNGNTDSATIRLFVDALPSRDTLALRKEMMKNTPNMNMEVTFKCPMCGFHDLIPLPISTDFFWPDIS